MRVLSLGAGVQSSTLLLMAVHGELKLDRAIFTQTTTILETDLARLTRKWQAAGKENQFLQDIRRRESATVAAQGPRRLTR